MASDEQTPEARLPPKLDLRKKGIVKNPAAGDAAANTPAEPDPDATVESAEPVAPKPAGAPPTVPKTDAGLRPVTAPKTVKIDSPLSAQKTPGEGTPAAPKTIRIASPAARAAESADVSPRPKTLRVQPPAENDAPAAPAGAQTEVQTLKKERPKPGSTVPIPLDDLAPQSTADQPKTIRLKKPAGGIARSPTARTAQKDGEGEAESPAVAPPTRKRTIKVKRPDRGTVKGRPVMVTRSKPKAQAGAESEEDDKTVVAEVGAAAVPLAAVEAETGVGAVLTVVAAVVAMIVVGVVAYLFAVQAFPLMGLPWPGIS